MIENLFILWVALILIFLGWGALTLIAFLIDLTNTPAPPKNRFRRLERR